MKLDFNIESVRMVEFGVGRDGGNGQSFVAVPVDDGVQAALRGMVIETWHHLQRQPDGPSKYEPSEKHGSVEYLYLALEDDFASSIRDLHEAVNLPFDSRALDYPATLFCYFARLSDGRKRRLTALRRATQFKGVLKSRLIRLVTDSLRLIEDQVFRLDSDFDLLVDSENVHILRPSGFEFAGKLQQAVLNAVPENIQAIGRDLAFVEFDSIERYASQHPRAARYLASIRGQEEASNIDKMALKKLCKRTGVEVSEVRGKVTVAAGHELGFLEVLDRRRYMLELVQGQPERFRASSRRRIDG